MSKFDWTDAIGYQHEVVHTGLLDWLLKDPDLGPELCRELSLPTDQPQHVRREVRVPGFKGIADLVAIFEQNPGQARYLAVETKVDSTRFAQREQLEKTLKSSELPDGSIAVLLALGVTHLCVAQDDLGDELIQDGWASIGPRRWAEMLEQIGVSDRAPVLRHYLERLYEEADLHGQAIELANGVGARGAVNAESLARGRNIEEFAWLQKVRREVALLSGNLKRSSWFPYKNQSGPLMGVFPASWKETQPEAFLEFMCDWNDRRFLCLKLGGGHELPMDLRESTQALALENAGMSRPGRRAGVDAKSCTVARLDLTEATAREAAEKTTSAFVELNEDIRELLFHFHSHLA